MNLKKRIKRFFPVFLLFLVAFSSTHAGEVTIPNTFTADTPAVAAEVNANFTALETAVDDNAADISTNSANITANEADIIANAAAISANEAGIAANAAAVSANDVDIDVNGAAIAHNAVDITDNAGAINDHSHSIYTHEGRLPVAFGHLNYSNLTSIRGTSNISAYEWNDTLNRYEITIDGVCVSINHVILATISGDNHDFIGTTTVGCKALVYMHDIDGNPQRNRSFDWMIYYP